MFKRKYILFLLLFLSFFVVNAQSSKYAFIIASGSRGGNYYKTANVIADAYNSEFKNASFSVIETNGSNENIELIKNNSVDFAIIQRNVLLNNMYKQGKGVKNIAVITPLFQEKLLIYYHGNKDISLKELDSLIGDRNVSIGFTSKKGFSYNVFKALTKFLNINLKNTKEVEDNYDNLIEKFKNNQIDILVSFSLQLIALEGDKHISKVYIPKDNALLLQSRLHNVFATSLTNNSDEYSLGSWSFLIGSKTGIQLIEPEEKLLNSLYKNTSDSSNNRISSLIESSVNAFVKNDNNELRQLNSLPLTSPLHKKLFSNKINYKISFIIIVILFLLFFLYFKFFYKNKIDLYFIWDRYKHFQYGILMLIFIYFASVELLMYAEKRFYRETGIKSQILNLTRADLHSWLLITTVTGNSNGIFPLSLLGKAMLALNSMNFWIGTILIGFSEYATRQVNKKRKLGIMETKYSNHIVIFGWNPNTEDFILETIEDAVNYNKIKIDIVCVVPNIEEVRHNNPKIKELHNRKRIDIIQGNALDLHTLQKCHVELANAVILLSDDGSKLSDERTAMRAHAISRYTKKHRNNGVVYRPKLLDRIKQKVTKLTKTEKEDVAYKKFKIEKTADSIYMIAELNNDNLKETLIDADVNEIIVGGNYTKSILKQSLFNHGISKVLDEIMQYNEYNEFYKIDLSNNENSHLRYKSYDELLLALRKQGILLIGIQIVFHDENDNIIIDQSVIKDLLKTEEPEGINRDIMINPTDKIECERLVDEDDHLIVLATNVEQLKKGVKEVVF